MNKLLKLGLLAIAILVLPALASAPVDYINPNDLYVQNKVAPKLTLQLSEIVECESEGNSLACNKQYGCRAGMGLVQLIPSTKNYCETKLNKTIDPFNGDDNWECGMWLLEYEGTKHWDMSKHCWG